MLITSRACIKKSTINNLRKDSWVMDNICSHLSTWLWDIKYQQVILCDPPVSESLQSSILMTGIFNHLKMTQKHNLLQVLVRPEPVRPLAGTTGSVNKMTKVVHTITKSPNNDEGSDMLAQFANSSYSILFT